MKNIKIKICGIKDTATLNCCNKLNVDFFGLIFFKKSPRNIHYIQAEKLINNQKKQRSIPVGVFVNHDFDDLCNLIKKINLRYVQLHGKENNEYISKLKNKFNLKVIKAIGIQKKNDLKKIIKYTAADFFLFDYKCKKNELPGGNAKSFDWSILNGANISKPWIIAGGINKYNIKDILNNLIPYGIDISSGVEDQPGTKNLKKIKEIVKIINEQ